MASRFAHAAGLALGMALFSHAALGAEGTIPNRTYRPDQLWQLVSPQMGEKHDNQPHVINGYLFLAGNAVHAIWDVEDPFRPQQLAPLVSPHHDGEAESHTVTFARAGDRFYACTISGRGIDFWDVTDARSPKLLAALLIDGIVYGDNTNAVWGVFWQGRYVYVGGTNTGLSIVDALDPQNPVLVRHVPVTEFGSVSAGAVFALGNLLVITTPKESAGLATLDISDPVNPRLLDFEVSPAVSYIGGFYGARAYLQMPFRSYDVTTDPADIRLVGSAETLRSEYMSFGEGYLFLGELRPNSGVNKVDISDPNALRFLGKVKGRPDPLCDDQFSIPIGNLLVLSDDELDIGSVLGVHATERDTTPPRVLYVNPKPGATGQALSTRIGLSFSDQIELASVNASTLVVRPSGGAPLAGRWGIMNTLLAFTPDAPLAPDTTYEVVVPAGGITDAVGNALADEFRSVFSTGASVVVPRCEIKKLMPTRVGDEAIFDATLSAPGASYRWDFGDGASSSNSTLARAPHSYAEPGRYRVTLTVTEGEAFTTCSAIHVAHRELTPSPAPRSSSVLIDDERTRVWVVNPDADTVSVVDMASLETVVETRVGDDPRSLARAPDGSVWVTNRGSSELSVLERDSGSFSTSVPLPYGSMPFGVVFAPDGRGFVALEATGQVAVIDPASRAVTGTVNLGPDASGIVPRVRGVALSYEGRRLFVPRFVAGAAGAEVYEIDAASLALARTFALANDPGPDTENSGRGIPNYLGSIAVSPDGVRAWLPSKKDNMDRGFSRDGQALNTDNTVRTVVSQLDLEDNTELSSARIDINDHDMAAVAAFSPVGDLVFVASQGTNQIDVFDAYDGSLVAGIATGLAPQGLELDSSGRLWVQSFLSRSLAVYDASGLLAGTDGATVKLGEVVTVAEEPLAPEVLLGKQIFYNADSRQMSQDGYTSCASCHLDGDDDGRVWDFTDRGEGHRNTISLVGKAGTRHGPVHWTGNFDEIQDFENDIRARFGGSGFMSDEHFHAETRSDPLGTLKAGLSPPLDALASYVSSLDAFPKSPHRNADGTLTEDARAGQALFDTLDCGTCHAGERLTDSAAFVLHDVGTLQPTSGQRRGEPLTGLDTPTLRGLWATAPYLHDGSAPTLRAVIDNSRHGDASGLNDTEKDQLVAFLLELDDSDDAIGAGREPRLAAAGGCGCRTQGRGPHGSAAWWLLGMLVVGVMRRNRLAARCRPTYL